MGKKKKKLRERDVKNEKERSIIIVAIFEQCHGSLYSPTRMYYKVGSS